MLVNYQLYLIATELFPEDADAFRFNSITRKDQMYFVNYPDSIALISAINDMTTTPHVNTGLTENFKVDYSPDDYFKSASKEMQVFLLLLRKENIRVLGAGTPSPLPKHRT